MRPLIASAAALLLSTALAGAAQAASGTATAGDAARLTTVADTAGTDEDLIPPADAVQDNGEEAPAATGEASGEADTGSASTLLQAQYDGGYGQTYESQGGYGGSQGYGGGYGQGGSYGGSYGQGYGGNGYVVRPPVYGGQVYVVRPPHHHHRPHWNGGYVWQPWVHRPHAGHHPHWQHPGGHRLYVQ
ncbi:hypothetical protein [Prosthecodimorpha staleyi]|uniref:Uncharacterized protein n=1 Tax=Prosthecodimorpha staleyi TaxID=2840188 RepID=A0A947GJS4_9HYPH|nr:hypothetical protein [Prosthecodimorpha staleyi]MBT9292294.1 hypothetical protein [Prosthecodimorpha staleyi]